MNPVTISRAQNICAHIHRGSQTARWYGTPVNQLIDMLGDVPIHTIGEQDIDRWHRYILGNGYSPHTIDSYTRAVKALFGHMVKMGHLDESPAAHIKLRKLPKKGPKEISSEDIERMIAASRYNVKAHAAIMVLASSGCRVGELVSMTVSGTEFTTGEDGAIRGKAIVSGKMNKTRYIFIDPDACTALKVYMDTRPWNSPNNLWLGRGIQPITANGIYQMLRRVGKRAGVERCNPHAFRHRAIKRWLESGLPTRVIQELAGHEDLSTTLEIYVSYTDRELERHHAALPDGY